MLEKGKSSLERFLSNERGTPIPCLLPDGLSLDGVASVESMRHSRVKVSPGPAIRVPKRTARNMPGMTKLQLGHWLSFSSLWLDSQLSPLATGAIGYERICLRMLGAQSGQSLPHVWYRRLWSTSATPATNHQVESTPGHSTPAIPAPRPRAFWQRTGWFFYAGNLRYCHATYTLERLAISRKPPTSSAG